MSFLWMFPFGLAMSAAGMLLSNGHLARWVRFLLHHVITLLAIFLFLWLPSNASPTGAEVLVFFALLCVLYWILFGLIAFLYTRIRKLMDED